MGDVKSSQDSCGIDSMPVVASFLLEKLLRRPADSLSEIHSFLSPRE